MNRKFIPQLWDRRYNDVFRLFDVLVVVGDVVDDDDLPYLMMTYLT